MDAVLIRSALSYEAQARLLTMTLGMENNYNAEKMLCKLFRIVSVKKISILFMQALARTLDGMIYIVFLIMSTLEALA